VLDGGEAHDELMAVAGTYADLFTLQAAPYLQASTDVDEAGTAAGAAQSLRD